MGGMPSASCHCTDGVLMGDCLKDVITGQGTLGTLPAGLTQEAAGSPFLKQYDPSQPRWVRNPNLPPETDLTNAFVPG